MSNLQRWMHKKANELKKRPTKAELVLYKALKKAKIHFIFQSPRWHERVLRIFDFWIPRKRIAIEVDGKIHNAEVDRQKDLRMKQVRPSYTILRFTNEEIINNPEIAISAITRTEASLMGETIRT